MKPLAFRTGRLLNRTVRSGRREQILIYRNGLSRTTTGRDVKLKTNL
jgi:hypothetical protein